jgi:methionine aminopeptidase
MADLTLAKLRRAVADYMASEGCSCCRDIDRHEAAKAVLAALLKVPKYKDGSGYDFYRFKTGGKQ